MVLGNIPAELLHEEWPLRARPHEAHLPLQDVDHLRQLIEPQRPEQPTDRGDPGVVGNGQHRPQVLLRIVEHGTELDRVKGPAVQADPLLAVEEGAGGRELDSGADHQHERQEQHQADQGEYQVKQALRLLLPRRQRQALDVKDGQVVHPVEAGVMEQDIIQLRDEQHLLVLLQAPGDDLLPGLPGDGGVDADHLRPGEGVGALRLLCGVEEPEHPVAPADQGAELVSDVVAVAADDDHRLLPLAAVEERLPEQPPGPEQEDLQNGGHDEGQPGKSELAQHEGDGHGGDIGEQHRDDHAVQGLQAPLPGVGVEFEEPEEHQHTEADVGDQGDERAKIVGRYRPTEPQQESQQVAEVDQTGVDYE